MAKTHYNLIILGAGPAGLTAGLYAARARMDHLLIEKGAEGGQILLTDWIDNYPGFPDGISGFDLAEKMTVHAKRFDLNSIFANVVSMDLTEPVKRLALEDGSSLSCDTLIICTGAHPRPLGIPGEKEFIGKGVSYCATCDGPFYRNMHVAVIGGGNTAVQEASHLTKFAKKVTLIHRRDKLRATKILQEKAFDNPKINFIWNSTVTRVSGTEGVEELHLLDNSGKESTVKVDGVFVLIGVLPNNEMLPLDVLKADAGGFIPTDLETRTSVVGVMAAGDIRSKEVRQVINAAGEGATAVLAAEHYLTNLS
ncbi:thioredoxin-disulfide reductase [Desulfocapsa sulfexigens DSM 10523]|uniref:Thioredoxin reductase n=1 Tax=Desulfocapsa sulfexigens (strain DSM 10523 / SB164P1) TaxID=1167006 RepID=M1P406_DESSD|nr:thioredoxin-disulfide reductase [Desulfocapsa sulfexigens]AGF78218.1 thioredoxin-disulfide reductase [Desulfocapsa sulfexigens DSM 10523]